MNGIRGNLTFYAGRLFWDGIEIPKSWHRERRERLFNLVLGMPQEPEPESLSFKAQQLLKHIQQEQARPMVFEK